jgi:transcriptional regulator with XRE-family HTH domain
MPRRTRNPKRPDQPEKKEEGALRLPSRVNASREAVILYEQLPKKGRMVLLAKLDPENLKLSQKALAEKIGIAEKTLYRYENHSQLFADALHAMSLRALTTSLPAIVGSSIQSAAIPGRDGFHDRKMLFEMGGLYERRTTLDVNGRIAHEHEVGDRMSQAILAAAEKRKARAARVEDDDAAPVIDVTPVLVEEPEDDEDDEDEIPMIEAELDEEEFSPLG